jgi:hypothetical protein
VNLEKIKKGWWNGSSGSVMLTVLANRAGVGPGEIRKNSCVTGGN